MRKMIAQMLRVLDTHNVWGWSFGFHFTYPKSNSVLCSALHQKDMLSPFECPFDVNLYNLLRLRCANGPGSGFVHGTTCMKLMPECTTLLSSLVYNQTSAHQKIKRAVNFEHVYTRICNTCGHTGQAKGFVAWSEKGYMLNPRHEIIRKERLRNL